MDGGQRHGNASTIRSCLHRTCPAIHEDALDFTAFALDQFRERADRDGAALAILSSHDIGTRGDLGFDRLTALTEPRGIPVV